jgi:hypothetical protein
MAKYFNYFPTTFYSSNNSTTGLDVVTNLVARFGFESQLKENTSAFYKYQIQESDTPEIIASKYSELVAGLACAWGYTREKEEPLEKIPTINKIETILKYNKITPKTNKYLQLYHFY